MKTQLASRQPLRSEDAVKQPFYDGFICKICQSVVEDPKQCQNCENLYCAVCLATWMKSKPTCPVCREVQDPSKMLVHPIVQNKLNATKFTCPTCKQEFELGKRRQHQCTLLLAACPARPCPAKELTIDQLSDHWANQCHYVKTECQGCLGQVMRCNQGSHSCIQEAKHARKMVDARLTDALRLLDLVKSDLQIFHECAQTLLPHTSEHQCDLCNSRITAFKCDCKNLCQQCVPRSSLQDRQTLRDQIARFLASQVKNCDKCRGEIAFRTKPGIRTAFAGKLKIVPSLVSCNKCKQKLKDKMYSCAKGCDFDLCVDCINS